MPSGIPLYPDQKIPRIYQRYSVSTTLFCTLSILLSRKSKCSLMRWMGEWGFVSEHSFIVTQLTHHLPRTHPNPYPATYSLGNFIYRPLSYLYIVVHGFLIFRSGTSVSLVRLSYRCVRRIYDISTISSYHDDISFLLEDVNHNSELNSTYILRHTARFLWVHIAQAVIDTRKPSTNPTSPPDVHQPHISQPPSPTKISSPKHNSFYHNIQNASHALPLLPQHHGRRLRI